MEYLKNTEKGRKRKEKEEKKTFVINRNRLEQYESCVSELLFRIKEKTN